MYKNTVYWTVANEPEIARVLHQSSSLQFSVHIQNEFFVECLLISYKCINLNCIEFEYVVNQFFREMLTLFLPQWRHVFSCFLKTETLHLHYKEMAVRNLRVAKWIVIITFSTYFSFHSIHLENGISLMAPFSFSSFIDQVQQVAAEKKMEILFQMYTNTNGIIRQSVSLLWQCFNIPYSFEF